MESLMTQEQERELELCICVGGFYSKVSNQLTSSQNGC